MNKDNQSSVHKVHYVSENQNPRNRKSINKLPNKKTTQTSSQYRGEKMCKFCGNKHVLKKELCPAWGKTCKTFHGRNHFKCEMQKSQSGRKKFVHLLKNFG